MLTEMLQDSVERATHSSFWASSFRDLKAIKAMKHGLRTSIKKLNSCAKSQVSWAQLVQESFSMSTCTHKPHKQLLCRLQQAWSLGIDTETSCAAVHHIVAQKSFSIFVFESLTFLLSTILMLLRLRDYNNFIKNK